MPKKSLTAREPLKIPHPFDWKAEDAPSVLHFLQAAIDANPNCKPHIYINRIAAEVSRGSIRDPEYYMREVRITFRAANGGQQMVCRIAHAMGIDIFTEDAQRTLIRKAAEYGALAALDKKKKAAKALLPPLPELPDIAEHDVPRAQVSEDAERDIAAHPAAKVWKAIGLLLSAAKEKQKLHSSVSTHSLAMESKVSLTELQRILSGEGREVEPMLRVASALGFPVGTTRERAALREEALRFAENGAAKRGAATSHTDEEDAPDSADVQATSVNPARSSVQKNRRVSGS